MTILYNASSDDLCTICKGAADYRICYESNEIKFCSEHMDELIEELGEMGIIKESDKPTKFYKFSYKSGHGITCEDLDDKPRNVSFKLFNGEIVDSDSYKGDSSDIEGIMITNVKGIFEKG